MGVNPPLLLPFAPLRSYMERALRNLPMRGRPLYLTIKGVGASHKSLFPQEFPREAAQAVETPL
jgi:hypothetical protein